MVFPSFFSHSDFDFSASSRCASLCVKRSEAYWRLHDWAQGLCVDQKISRSFS